MKTTHSLEQVEALMWKESDILKDPNVGKERKKEAVKKLKLLEKHFRDCSDKHVNGKKYPKKVVPKDTPKKELLALIDSVPNSDLLPCECEMRMDKGLDVSGVFTSDDRTTEFPRTSILDGKYLPNASTKPNT